LDVVARLGAGLLAALAGTALVLQINTYPLSRGLLASVLTLVAIALARWPRLWVAVLPAALPLAGLAPWSGVAALDEFDALLLATLVLEHARRALMPAPPVRLLATGVDAGGAPGVPAAFLGASTGVVLGLFALAVAVGLWRGLLPLPVFDPSLLATYDARFNALRLAKPAVLALAFQPLIVDALRRDAAATLRRLAWGLAAGLSIAAVMVGVEQWLRYAHGASTIPAVDGDAALLPGAGSATIAPPLTAGFWEMHVGGATLDAFLLLTLPAAGWLIASSLPQRRRASRHAQSGDARRATVGVPVAGMVGCAILALGLFAIASRTRTQKQTWMPGPLRWRQAGVAAMNRPSGPCPRKSTRWPPAGHPLPRPRLRHPRPPRGSQRHHRPPRRWPLRHRPHRQ
jgi:hypothetical protein